MRRAALAGTLVTITLVVVTASVEGLFPFDAHTLGPPLHAQWWRPRVGPGTAAALVLGAVGVIFGPRAAMSWRWSRLLPATWFAGVLWMLSLALVDGVAGITDPLLDPFEYLRAARAVEDVPAVLSDFVSRIPFSAAPDNWPPHVAGHPPGVLLFFVGLVHLGLGSGLEAGLVMVLVGATTPLAVVTTLRALDAEQAARRVVPFLALTPAAIWVAVSADGGLFAPTAAWGVACLAVACRRRSHSWGAMAGLLLGLCVFLSYGLVLVAILAVAVLVAARTAYPLVSALVAALAVTAAFLATGYSWFGSYGALAERYHAGVARRRPDGYWVFGNLAAFVVSAGPLVGSALGHASGRALAAPRRRLARLPAGGEARVVALLGGAGWLMVLLADVSGMSQGEVERIWLPFVPWALLLVALLPPRWRRWGLLAQAVTAVLVQHLVFAKW